MHCRPSSLDASDVRVLLLAGLMKGERVTRAKIDVAAIISAVLIVLGLVGTFPTFFQAFE
jgi:hypothetical protein